jgi:predicted ribosome quality control (RQC) complex YloA/Tae2 family protein
VRTDPELIRRLAGEIEARFRGAKARDVGLLPDGRVAIELWSHGERVSLCIDVFFSPPMVTAEHAESPTAAEPGFVRAAGAAIRGTVLLRASSRTNDRLVRLTFGTRSRFGIQDAVDLYVELVPRFGNIVLVKGERVVAALKEFSPSENAARTIQSGARYELPPLVARARVQESSVPENESVLDAFLRYREQCEASETTRRRDQRRRSLIKRLDERERKLRSELEKIQAKRTAALDRASLRIEGEAIYASLHAIDSEREREAAKERAAALFARYKKLGASLAHLARRESTVTTSLRALEDLRWEAERAEEPADLEDVERAAGLLDARGARVPASPQQRKRRAPLEIRTARGSRILVGRSPTENAELTFHVARPDDLWFHARNLPGAHVILQRGDRSDPPDDDVGRAASLAAYYSKARASGSVLVDYTRRKYVRAQRDAPPGLVWYTEFKTIQAKPESP